MKEKGLYFDFVKFIRDIVHSYIYLTNFDLDLIDTPEFQRLKDIRQLTCQSVYPCARHTRFEHSLGVLELTRQAMKNLNKNGIISNIGSDNKDIFDDKLQFNASVAALLHDVGHCPFSHMGEAEFDKKEVWERLQEDILNCEELKGTSLKEEVEKYSGEYKDKKKPGSVHEQLGCIVILEKYYNKLKDVSWENEDKATDFELIIRSIIGLEYDTSTEQSFNDYAKKNIVVRLINSQVFDMDKLDYIMRDSLYTAIGTPQIDTKRLFKNMYLKSEWEYGLVFTHRAEPALQNMIEARNKLYMYVYNHHAAVFSDFIYSYIFRKLARSPEVCREIFTYNLKEAPERNDRDKLIDTYTSREVNSKAYIFSVVAVVEKKRSDSDMISLLNDIYNILEQKVEGNLESFKLIEGDQYVINNIKKIYVLIGHYQKREFLKPWWKTNFEFTDFINHNFRDDHVREQLCAWICQDEDEQPAGDEFRSQLAKHVIYITKEMCDDKDSGLLEPLEDGDFFVIKRATHFYRVDAISKLDIALKNSEITGSPNQVKTSTKDYYIKELTNISPICDYYSIYPKESFYIFSKPLKDEVEDLSLRRRHYQTIEQIFVFVATELIREGALEFQKKFKDCEKEKVHENEKESMRKLLEDYKNFRGVGGSESFLHQ